VVDDKNESFLKFLIFIADEFQVDSVKVEEYFSNSN